VIIGASGGGSPILLFIILAFGLVYLLFVRPQRKRQSQQQQMMSDLRVGDEVLTVGGIYGTVSQLDEDEVTVEIAPDTEVRVARRAIAGVTREEEDEEPTEDEEGAEPEASAEPEETAEPEEPQADEGPGAATSNEENRG